MKKFLILFSIAVVAVFAAVSCHDSDTKLVVRNMQKSDCKVTQSDAPLQMRVNSLLAEPEYITLTAMDNGYMKIFHENAIYGCDCEKVQYGVLINDKQILLTEDPGESFANCLCTIDCSCEIGQLEEGDYTLTVVNRDGEKIISFAFVYTANLKMVVPVNEVK